MESKIDYLKDVGFYDDISSVDAIEVSTQNQDLLDWLISEVGGDLPEKIQVALQDICNRALVIKSIYVDEDFRGQGIGSRLLDDLLDNTSAQSILLVADVLHDQRKGFDLIKFYRDRGFGVLHDMKHGPLMMYPYNTCTEISSRLSSACLTDTRNRHRNREEHASNLCDPLQPAL